MNNSPDTSERHSMHVGMKFFDEAELDLGLQRIQILGHGYCGTVEEVSWNSSKQVFALKTVPNKSRKEPIVAKEIAIKMLRGETAFLSKYKHRHVIQLIGSYCFHNSLDIGLFLSPVAECNLMAYLRNFSSLVEQVSDRVMEKSWLVAGMGCIASALSYIHGDGSSHNDVSSTNILLLKRKWLLSDFGLAYNSPEEIRTDTNPCSELWGPYISCHRKYMAPEVDKSLQRGSKADIFSLGCVFLEVCTVIRDETLDTLDAALIPHPLYEGRPELIEGYKAYYRNVEVIGNWGQKFGWDWLVEMVKENPTERPSAEVVWKKLALSHFEGSRMCGDCCLIVAG